MENGESLGDENLRPVKGTEPIVEIVAPSETPPPSPEPPPPGVPTNATQGGALGKPRQAIQDFLQAASWQDRLKFIHKGEEIRDQVGSYYQTHDDESIVNFRVDFFHNETHSETGHEIFVFFVTFQGEADGFPVIVLEKDDTYHVDWELFVEFRDRHFKKFVEEKRTEPDNFRVVIQRVEYWESDRNEIPNLDSLICYKIDPPYPGFTVHAFVPKNSDEGKAMIEQLTWKSDPLAAEVTMHWEKFSNGTPYLTIDQIASPSWVRP